MQERTSREDNIRTGNDNVSLGKGVNEPLITLKICKEGVIKDLRGRNALSCSEIIRKKKGPS